MIDAPKKIALEKAILQAINFSKELLADYGLFDIQLKRNPEKAPHPQGQEAFIILVKFPWQPTPLCRVKIEITHDEPVVLSPEYKPILHGYEEALDYQIACYPIEEIIAEKMRALLQTHQKLITRGWNRPRARDYYDLWCILKHYSSGLNNERLVTMLNQKCEHRQVAYRDIEDFFTHELMRETRLHWNATLGVLVKNLADAETVIIETRSLLTNVFSKL